ncbi:MAG TPA: type II toxin-antitoxin system RelB/DinJ family antitoxin [Candidatus Paceibacterota bacterium]|nr:type II toxin-antitoxin system RelB/DinJ family antitoxin [Candidatus Paceibacterota bacterium]
MTTLNVRIEEKTKKAAQKTLANMGLDMSTAVNMFLRQVIRENGLPFTPISDAKAKMIRERWDKGVQEALKRGKYYTSAREMMKDLLKEDA